MSRREPRTTLAGLPIVIAVALCAPACGGSKGQQAMFGAGGNDGDVGGGLGGLMAPEDGGVLGGCTAPSTYGSLFTDLLGKSADEVDAKVDGAFQSLFHGGANNTVYYEAGSDQAYILDVYDDDVRTEGMSYGMMIAVQLDKKEEFDHLWSWARQFMYQSSGPGAGYFAWHRKPSGAALQTFTGPAPDGEEYFATALIFASTRWGDGDGIFDYAAEARALLDVMAHKGESSDAQQVGITSMFDPGANLVVFAPSRGGASVTDPSYITPAFYDVWACFDEKNRALWQTVAATARAFFPKVTDPDTGLAPELAGFDGTPSTRQGKGDFRFDAWRVVTNVMADYHLRGIDPWQATYAARLGGFFRSQGNYGEQYTLSGSVLDATHSVGLAALNATLGFALPAAQGQPFVQELWNLSVPSGQYRYYNGLLYMLSLLHASGKYHLWF